MSLESTTGPKHITQVKKLRKDVMEAIRALVGVIKHTQHKQRVLDLVTKLGVGNDPDYAGLPAKPDGFVVTNTAYIANGTGSLRTQCEYQVVSMLITYFWLFGLTGDMQDLRSAMRYKGWIDRYVKDHAKYEVCGDVKSGFWLANTSILKDGEDPTLPQWLKDDGGETV
jgi:hypothetical protein